MKKFLLIGLMFILASFVLILFLLPPKPTPPVFKQELPIISATIFPIYDITRAIGNGVVDTRLLLPPGASPHTFEISPQTMRALEQSKRVFMIGYGLDQWVADLLDDESITVVVDSEIEIRFNKEVDPHYWLDAKNAKQIAKNIARALTDLIPQSSDAIEQNLNAYVLELDALDAYIRQLLSTVENKKMITFHDAWYYFANAYGLEIAETFEPAAGREPTPQHLAKLALAISTAKVRTLYAEPQFSKQSVQAFLQDYGITITTIDPLGGAEQTDSYLKLMRANADTIFQNQ